MNFAVEWSDEALVQLAAAWNAADDRDAVTAASYRLEAQLRANPTDAGESRDGGFRVAFDPPLRVGFRPLPDQRLVVVNSVGLMRRRG